MINLDQVRTLEWKVKQAVQLIVHLRRENDTLRGRLSDTEVRLQELESLLESFKATQNEMESGIRSALEELDHLETGSEPVSGPVEAVSYPPAETEAVLEEQAPPVAAAPAAATAEDAAFEEEYAALAAAEASALERLADEEPELMAEPPASVELEEEAVFLGDEALELESEPEIVPEPEEKQPEQPGLGIF